MTPASVTTAGIICPGFGAVSDEPPDEAALATRLRRDDLTLKLREDPAYVKVGRDHTAAVMSAWGLSTIIPDATLVASELVTNALRHAVSGTTGGPVLLRLVRRGQDAMCLVADGSDRPPELVEPDFVAETGRGLHLVAANSRRWHWARRRHRPGKWVWALLPLPGDARR